MTTHPYTSDAITIDVLDSEIANAMDLAKQSQISWSQTSLRARRNLLRKLRHLIARHAMELAESSASQRGRPAVESLTAEVLPLLEACKFVERELSRLLAPQHIGRIHRPLWLAGITSVIVREPYGVILIIGPGNYPLMLPGIQMIQAVMAGNAVLLKPGLGGEMAAKFLVKLMHQAGCDQRLCIVLPENVEVAVEAIKMRPDKVIFTGSSTVGKQILHQLADHAIPSTMELSGCDAVIIQEDADLDLAASSIAFGLTLNDGATCMAPRRVFINVHVAKNFETKLRSKLDDRLKDGAYFKASMDLNLSQRFPTSLKQSIAEAIDRGSHMLCGSIDLSRSITCPVVITNVPQDHDLLREDHFAPLLSITYVESDEQALDLTNSHDLGLGASIFTADLDNARRMAAAIKVGVVSINDLIIPTADARLPLGGRGNSGFGTTQGAEGLLEMTVPKVISINRKSSRPAYAPLRETDGGLMAAFAQVTHLRGLRARSRALMTLIDQLRRYKRH